MKRPHSIDLVRSLGRPAVYLPDKMIPVGLGRPFQQPIKSSFADYLAMFTRFRSHTRIVGKGNMFDFATIIHSTNSTKLHWKEMQLVAKELNCELTFFLNYEQKMVAVSRNTGSAPLTGSRIIWDHALDGSVWSKKDSPHSRSGAKSDTNCVRSESDLNLNEQIYRSLSRIGDRSSMLPRYLDSVPLGQSKQSLDPFFG